MNRLRIFTFVLLLLPSLAIAQQKDTLVKKLDSLNKKTDSLGGNQKNDIKPETYNENTRITFRNYWVLTANDSKQQLTAPFRANGNTWLKIGGYGLLTAGCALFADKPINRLAVNIRNS